MEVPFYFDDLANIKNNLAIRLTKFSLKDAIIAGFGSLCPRRPIVNLSFAFNYYFHEYNIIGYHVINTLVHVLTGFFFYLFIESTLSIPSLRSKYTRPFLTAFFTALVWLVHPIQTQSVTYIVQRMNSLAAMFYILSLLFYVKGRLARENRKSWPWFVGCGIVGILGAGSKEFVATLPFFIFLYEWYFFQDLNMAWLKRRLPYIIGTLMSFALFAFLYMGSNPLKKVLSGYSPRDFTLAERVLTQFRVVIYYLSLLIYPHPARLNLDHYFPLSHSLIDPITTILSMAAITVLIGFAFCIAKKERLISFCILWFFGNLVIESSIIPLELVFEHRTYLPSMLFFLVPIVLAFKYIQRDWAIVGILCAVMLVFSLWTYKRNEMWREPVTFWKDCAEKSEKKERPNYNLAKALLNQERYSEAIVYLYKVLQIDPDHVMAHNNIGIALVSQGKLDEAIEHYSTALKIKPGHVGSYNNIGIALSAQGKLNEAIKHYSEAIRIDPDYVQARYNMGITLAKQGRLDEAIAHFSEALRIDPDLEEVHNELGLALAEQGKLEKAVRHFSEALRINPDLDQAHNYLGTALARQGKLEEAIAHFSEALRINPKHAHAHKNWGLVLVQQGKLEEAIAYFSKALQINPDFEQAHNELGIALARQERLEEAVVHFSEALRINPIFDQAHNNLGTALARQGKLEEAIAHFSEALRINADLSSARSNLQNVMTIQKNFP